MDGSIWEQASTFSAGSAGRPWFSVLAGCCAALLVLAAAGCGGNRLTTAAPEQHTAAGGFSLTVSPDSFLAQASVGRFELQARQDADETVVAVRALGSQGLKAFYADLAYDATRYAPVAAAPDKQFGKADGVLSLAVLDDPGTVHYGQVLANCDRRPGLSGDLTLAAIRFRPVRAGREEVITRLASAAPTGDASAVALRYDEILGYSWLYANQGDYNQDGLVSINDLTPLGVHFGESGPFEIESAMAMIDGNADELITVSDITPIGVNFGSSVLGGYNVYVSTDYRDYPLMNDSISLLPALENVPFSEATGDRAVNRLGFTRPILTGLLDFYIWLRPADAEGNEGTPSNRLFINLGPAPLLSLVTPALGGSGTLLDPYILDPAVTYEISLTHSTLGDITGVVGTLYRVTPLVVGETPAAVHPLEGTLEISDGFTGMFTLDAEFNDVPAIPLIYFRVPNPANLPPIAYFVTDPASGPAPLSVTFDASGSSDPDGVIIQYEWDFESDGAWDEASPSSDGYWVYHSGGSWTAELRVIDDNGDTGTTSWPVNVEGWELFLVDERPGSGTDPSLAMIDGRPAIAYTDTGGNVDYVRALDADGSDWSPVVQLSDTSNASQVHLREIDNRPAVVFKRSSLASSGIRYTLGANADGTGWSTYAGISSGENDHSPSLNLIGSQPAIAYAWDSGVGPNRYQLHYIRASDATGTGSGAWDSFPGIVFSAELLSLDQQSLIAIEGKPAIIFISDQDEIGQRWKLRLIIADDIGATGWGFPTPLAFADPPDTLQLFAVTTIVDRPYIVWQRVSRGDVLFRRAHSLDGGDWSSNYGVGDCGADGTRGFFLELANIAGFPGLCHYDAEESQLRYVRSMDPENSGGWVGGQVVADVGAWNTVTGYNRYVSLASNAGKPNIAYYDATATKLMFARFHDVP